MHLSSLLLVFLLSSIFFFFFFNDPPTTEIYTLPLHDALPISGRHCQPRFHAHLVVQRPDGRQRRGHGRSEEHTSELQSLAYLVCRLLLEKKKKIDLTKLIVKNKKKQIHT